MQPISYIIEKSTHGYYVLLAEIHCDDPRIVITTGTKEHCEITKAKMIDQEPKH